ncbi:hypothetical protein BCR39DRAFT_534797 [Naematelia encephala]|uniref:FYVE-type domain-containing protein n=1 Tax=Naematelia encephala TaxID=71784 RepID=A0A1Y2B0X7_9TREE|nr:hypothetical protein BCR39DRAFT_534797 [Naematelia encephala]
MSDALLHVDTVLPVPSAAPSTRPSPVTGLTTFPNPFADDPEPGLLPALLSKVKSTFASASTATTPTTTSTGKAADRGSSSDSVSQGAQTEAQQLAEAVKNRVAQTRKQSGSGTSIVPIPAPPAISVPNEASSSGRPQPSPGLTTASHRSSLKPSISSNNSNSTSTTLVPPSFVSSAHSTAPARRLVPPGERQWRPTGAAPAQVTISPVTSVTTTVQASKNHDDGFAHPAPPRVPLRAHFGLQAAVASSSRTPLIQHAHSNSLGGIRNRRSSIATIPDSPSSISLSAMIAANAELSQNPSYVPGFPLQGDDTRSVRSLGFVKKTNSVSRIIRRMRGEGLSKHYWMADEHCKECYDCKSLFTAWRRKHHCRICGQIFCSRCASNIIGARRFGQDGAVRVCNLCLKIMEEYRDEDEDDRRSISSVTTTGFRLPSISDRALLDAAISPETPYIKSPFAASQLFSSNPNDSLAAIDETSAVWGQSTEHDSSRPFTPHDIGGSQASDEDDGQIWTLRPGTAAPFRRPMDEDAKSGDAPSESRPTTRPSSPPSAPSPDEATTDDSQKAVPKPVKVTFPRSDTISSDGHDVARIPLTRVDSNQPLIGLRTRLSSKASQGGLTALLDPEKNEGLWRARSHSFAHRPEVISGASHSHLDHMLEQAIARAELPSPAEWHRVLSKLLLKVSTDVHPNIRAGDSMDVRAYVKIKKVPGGKISDSEYVDGIVISKNVAHKAMPRRLVNPRIMVVTFPLDYHRVDNQFMSLDPILAQEKDYLRLLTRRIVDVRPHIVLVERSASRIALDYLLEANIAVARSVKLSAIHQVARCTQADVVASMDRLALEPRLGRCAEFQIQSFEHELIPGRRKTLMRFEGCHRDYGCTIIIRGGDLATLRKVKVITDFMSLVAYHLKNEIILYNDEHNIYPPHPPLSPEYEELLQTLQSDKWTAHSDDSQQSDDEKDEDSSDTPSTPKAHVEDEERALERRQARMLTRDIALSLEPYLRTILSASAAIRFPPPVPLAKMAELDRTLNHLRLSRDEDEAAQILQEETQGTDQGKASVIDANAATPIGLPTTASDTVTTMTSEVSSSTAMSTIPTASALPKDMARDPYRVLRRPEEISRESFLAQVEHDHSEQLKLWQWYTRRHTAQLRPEDYQGIVYLYSLGCEGTEKPCVEPVLQQINFYQPDDLTVGQFLEALAVDAGKKCPNKACERLLLFHFRLLVHDSRRLQIAMDQFPCPSPGHEDRIITWSYCRLCATPSPTTIIREETWKMSWGAYLEHCFYPPETRAGFTCGHDAYRDQIRYFAHRNLAIRIHNEPIDLYHPVRPSISLQVKAEIKVLLKNQEYESALHKNAAFFDSVLFRLRGMDSEIVQPEKVSLLQTALEGMLARAVADREELVNLLNRTYKLTPMTDVLAINTVLRNLQDKVVQWDADFADIEKAFMPSEKDLRRMTATHLKRLFANQDVFNSLDRNVTNLTVSEADEKDEKLDTSESNTITEPATPSITSEAGSSTLEPPQLDLHSIADERTPTLGIIAPVSNPMSEPQTPGQYDSDSTISAAPKISPSRSPAVMMERVESSGVDSDAHPFVSRLPRRSRPAPRFVFHILDGFPLIQNSIADLVKRFQDAASTQQVEPIEEQSLERPKSSASTRRSRRSAAHSGSDSESAIKARPRLRRGRTEQAPVRHRETSKPGLLSDGDRSYAHHASRIPSTAARKTFGGPTDYLRPGSFAPTDERRATPRSGRTSPEDGMKSPYPSLFRSNSGHSKPRMSGKGKQPRAADASSVSGRVSPGPMRAATRRAIGGSSRVTSIARHFDRLSREAERERQKRISMIRGKRARPVGVTKAKVQVFDNLRDAFKDEFDTDSSEADNEEDDQGSDDSVDSAGESKIPGKPSGSPSKRHKSTSPEKPSSPSAVPLSTTPFSDALETGSEIIPISASGSSIAAHSMGETRSEMSFTDRLQIELPTFETSAPLPSVPATPQLSADTADEGMPARSQISQLSQMSESEMSSGGERSSIIRTLTGLWAFRAGDYTPLEYPL